MPQNQEDKKVSITETSLFQLVISVYGPYAFSIVALLILWIFIVTPQLELQKVNYEKNEEIVQALREIVNKQAETARTTERTAIVLDEIVQRISNAP